MVRNLITAMLVATAPITINNSQTTTTRNVNNQIYYEQSGENLTNAQSGKRYLLIPNSSIYNYNLVEYQENGYIQMTSNTVNNNLIVTVDMINIQKLTANVLETPYDEIYTRLNKAWYIPYENQYLFDAEFYQGIIEEGNNNALDTLVTNFIALRTLPTWTDTINQNYARNIFDQAPKTENEYYIYGDDAINFVIDPTLIAYTNYFQSQNGQIQYSILYQRLIYHFGNNTEITLPTSTLFVNPIQIEITWTIPQNPSQDQIVDIPGLLLEILGMPFAFISQAFNLTIFPNTPYAVNLSHIFLALICAGIMIFIIKKVIK